MAVVTVGVAILVLGMAVTMGTEAPMGVAVP